MSDPSGYWWIDLANTRTIDRQALFAYIPSDVVHLSATGGPATLASGDAIAAFAWPFDLTLQQVAEREIALGVSWNLVALPVTPTESISLSQLARTMNGDGVNRLAQVFRYTSQQWEGALVSGTMVLGTDFVLRPGDGYFLRMWGPAVWHLAGHEVPAPIKLNLDVGWNLVGVPASDGLLAVHLTDHAGVISGTTTYALRDLVRWVHGEYEGHVAGYSFNNFPIADTQGYFIRANVAGILVPGQEGYLLP